MIKRLIQLYKHRKNPDFHPKCGKKIIFGFELDGVKYYQFEQILDMPKERFDFMNQFYNEMQLKITNESLKQMLDAAIVSINSGKLGDASRVVQEIKERLDWFHEEETVLRFASVQYFTLDEDILSYNVAYNEKKIAEWRKKKAYLTFLRMWSNEGSKPLNTSTQDLEIYLKRERELVEQQKLYTERLLGKSA